MGITSDHVKCLLKSNSVSEIINAQSVAPDRFKNVPLLTHRKLYEFKSF